MPKDDPTLRFNIIVKQGAKTLHYIQGVKELPPMQISMKDVSDIQVLEQMLERLTGLRFHIQSETRLV